MAVKKEVEKHSDSLVGCYFHVWEDKKICLQGVVRRKLDEKHYLVQLFDWLIGAPSIMLVYPIEAMVANGQEDGAWQFYAANDDMLTYTQNHQDALPEALRERRVDK